MDRKQLLAERQNQHKQCTKNIKDFLNNIIDDQSFVESNEFFANDDGGKSVVWGQASIGGKLVFVVAQNSEVTQGGMSKQQAKKFVKACNVAYDNNLPVVFVLDSCGGKIEEGVSLLNNYAKVLASAKEANQPTICVVKGNALGSMAVFASLCDFVYMTEESVIALNSPAVLVAKEDLKGNANQLFGAKLQSSNCVCSFAVKKEELSVHLAKLLDTIYNAEVDVDEASLNKALGKIEKTDDVNEKIAQLVDKDSFMELYSEGSHNAIVGLARIGGIAVGIIATAKNKCDSVICPDSLAKMSKFADICYNFSLPLISIVDCKGIYESYAVEDSFILKEMSTFIDSIAGVRKISLITGEAIGFAYTLFASKAFGYESVIAWESAVVAPVAKEVGGLVVYGDDIAKADDPITAREEAIAKYEAVDSDPYYAATKGLVDHVIDAKQSRIYLIAELQAMLNK